ncbi:hypothetical protein UFOVP346_38 [uncultured Caudovirales phage]|uniref:Uncharacterized protein n=1 Tax=uncultured Caudovirales phage TaxID=2100421 RepID=A0A6J5LZK6_9CAUD|nr:hypothetical protein UFOVP346_38 [uncultured Caudovirales phage]
MAEKIKLPALNPFLARSTYATILTVVTAVSSAFNVDILGNFGTSEEGILDAVDSLLPVVTGLWLWLERRNPSFRIAFK